MEIRIMKYVYAIIGESSQNITTTPSSFDGHILMNSERPIEGEWIAADSGEWVEVFSEEGQRQWRDTELLKVASQESIWKYAYNDVMTTYMAELANFTELEGFPDVARLVRPLTAKGYPIIL